MTGESWHQERNRIMALLKAIESGIVTHVDEEDLRQLGAIKPQHLELLKERLAKLNTRLGDEHS